MNFNILKMLLIVYIALGILFVYLFFKLKKKQSSSLQKNIIKSKSGSFLYNSYSFFQKYSLSKKYLNRIRKRIEIIEILDNWTLCKKTMQFAYLSIGISLVSLVVLLSLSNSLYFSIISIFTVYIVHEEILDNQLLKADNKLLKQLEQTIGDIRHFYHQSGIVEDAFYDTIEVCDYEIGQHMNEIQNILSSENMEELRDNYFEKVPNKYFKVLVSISEIIVKYGDKKVNDQWLFLKNLNHLKEESNIEILKREKIEYLFTALTWICIAPLFFAKFMELWVSANMPELLIYYKGAYGLIADVTLFIISILAYKGVKQLKSPYYDIKYNVKVEEKLYKFPFVRRVVKGMTNKYYTESIQIKKILKTTGVKVRVEYFYIKRMLYGILGFLMTLVVIISCIFINRDNLVTLPINLEKFESMHYVYNMEDLKKLGEDFIIKYKGDAVTYEEIEKEILKLGITTNPEIIAEISTQVVARVSDYNKEHFKWWHLLLGAVIGMLSYNIPYVALYIRKKLVERMMHEEVFQFHTILLIIMHMERMTVNDILEWLEQFAVIFKESLSNCITSFEYDDNLALEELKQEEDFIPLGRIIESLQMATEKVSIKQAFDTLESDRQYYIEKRKQDNEMMVKDNSILGTFLAFTPLTVAMGLYALIPFVSYSINYLMIFTEQIKTIL